MAMDMRSDYESKQHLKADTPVVVALNRVHILAESRSETEMVACARQLLLSHLLPSLPG
jgi:hypothetical protein